MAVGFVLLSRMDADTSTWLQSLYLFVLGAGIGLCMQVLVLIVQNTVELRRSRRGDLGRDVLPDHRKLVRRSDFRVAVHQLPRRPHRARAGRAARRRRRRSRRRRCTRCRRRWPHPSSTPTPTRSGRCSCTRPRSPSSGSSSALFLKEVPLREMRRSVGHRPRRGLRDADAPSRPRRCSRWRSAGCCGIPRRSACAAFHRPAPT